MGPVRAEALVVHGPQDAAMHGLQAITGIGQRAADDDRHRIVEEGALHLLLDLDDGDVLGLYVFDGCV